MKNVDVASQQPSRDRVEFGHKFKWSYDTWRWETTAGRKVFVSPPLVPGHYWYVTVPSTGVDLPLSGTDAENRAFCIAEGYSRQQG